MTMVLLKSIDRLIILRLSLSLCLWCFLVIRFRSCILTAIAQKSVLFCILSGGVRPTAGHVHSYQLNKVLSARLCGCTVSLFLFLINDHFVGICFETTDTLFLIKLSIYSFISRWVNGFLFCSVVYNLLLSLFILRSDCPRFWRMILRNQDLLLGMLVTLDQYPQACE